MKYFETKHERNSAKITVLVMLVIVLLCFVVGQTYMDPPEEYGVALNFDGSGVPTINNNPQPVQPTLKEEPAPIEEQQEEVVEEEQIESEPTEDVVEDNVEDEQVEETTEDKAAEDLLKQQEEEALRLKEEKEAKEAKEAAERAEKEKAAKAAKEAAERKAAAAAKAEADRKAAADKAAADKAAREAANRAKFKLSQVPAIYPGCEGGDNAAKEKCTRSKLNSFVAQNFNTQVAENLGIKGIQSIMIVFDIDTTGKVVRIRAQASNPELANEAKRVTALIPKLKPAMQQGKPTKVSFRLPIKINIQ